MLVDTSDTYGIDVLKSGKIESPEDKFIKQIVKPGWIVVDVGVHWGGFSILFGKLVGIKGKVISFEASSKNFKLLKKNISINLLKDIVKPFHLAVGDEEKLLKFPLATTSSGHNSLIRKDLPALRYEDVNQIKLDSFLPSMGIEKIDFLKLDIEGYEYFALKGAEQIIKNSPNLWLFIEFSPSFMGKDLTQTLLEFLKKYFNEVYIARRKKIFKTDWQKVLEITQKYGQKNLFLYRGRN